MLNLNKVYLGDCLNVMDDIDDKSIALVLCDLPYGTTKCSWDEVISFDLLWKQYERIISDNGLIILHGSQPFTSKLILSNLNLFRYSLVWAKTRNSYPFFAKKRPLPQHEDILIFGNGKTYNPQMVKSDKPFKRNSRAKGHLDGDKEGVKWDGVSTTHNERYPTSVLKISNPSSECVFHPTQKPIQLCEYLIKTYSNENEVVLDNCAGSGSTLVAAKNLNRPFIGIEKEKKYYDICIERLK